MNLGRLSRDARKETLLVPRHRQLALDRRHQIFEQACRYIPKDELRDEFYTG